MNENFLNIDPMKGVALTKKAILLVGPESSGTKLLAKCFIDCFGCAGDDTIDGTINESEELIMVRFSLPSGPVGSSRFVDVQHVTQHLKGRGFDVHAVVTSRNWYPMLESSVRQTGNNDSWMELDPSWDFHCDPNTAMTIKSGDNRSPEETNRMIQAAYCQIFKGLVTEKIPFTISNYESLVFDSENHLKSLASILDLEYSGLDFEIRNENQKYFGAFEEIGVIDG